ncbi:hypothetical protein N8920_05485 [Opitutales bacterium]|nr:hypothetical protein [Opitutales bacterium]
MKICFISGPYQPQRCGISDYIDLLISEFSKINIECVHTIINQKNPLSKVANNLPDADIYSIQFAPYFFSPTGLSANSLQKLAASLRNRKLHINFHEIWVGAYPKAKWKEKILGWFQKKEIKSFIKVSEPKIITCSNSAVLDRLQKESIKAQYLYLCGTVPFSPCRETDTSDHLRVAFFGTLYEKFNYEHTAVLLKNISISLKKNILIDVIGRQREDDGFKKMQATFKSFGFITTVTGELNRTQISRKIQKCKIGVTTTPYDIIGKSSATATLLEHRIPIIAFDDRDTPTEKLFVMKEFEEQVFLLDDDSVTDRLLKSIQKPRIAQFDGAAYTAKEMLKLLR